MFYPTTKDGATLVDMRSLVIFGLSLVGCYTIPERLPPYDGVPLEPTDFSCQAPRTESVSCVIDGDTFDIGGCGATAAEERFRMLGIDAPETGKNGDPDECFAREAADALADVLETREVFLEFDDTCEGEFGRTLAWAFLLPDEEDPPFDFELLDEGRALSVNEWLVEEGYVRVYRAFNFEDLRYADALNAAEESAKARGRGLWGACGGS